MTRGRRGNGRISHPVPGAASTTHTPTRREWVIPALQDREDVNYLSVELDCGYEITGDARGIQLDSDRGYIESTTDALELARAMAWILTASADSGDAKLTDAQVAALRAVADMEC